MKKIIATTLAAFLVASPSFAEWENKNDIDPFDGERLFSINRAIEGGYASIVIRKVPNRKIVVYVNTGEYLCARNDILPVDVIIDGGRVAKGTRMSLSADSRALFFPYPEEWIPRFNEGNEMHLRVTDTCGDVNQYKFDISGRTQFE